MTQDLMNPPPWLDPDLGTPHILRGSCESPACTEPRTRGVVGNHPRPLSVFSTATPATQRLPPLRKCSATIAGRSTMRLSCAATASRSNCAMLHTSGVALPVPDPNANPPLVGLARSQTCSGIMPPALAKRSIAWRYGVGSAPRVTSYSPRSPAKIGHSRPTPSPSHGPLNHVSP